MMIQLKTRTEWAALAILAIAYSQVAMSQTPRGRDYLPDAPASRLLAQAGTQPTVSRSPAGTAMQLSILPLSTTPSTGKIRLTLNQAEQMAVNNNPRVSLARLLALAQHQVYRESRAAELPTANAAVTAVEAEEASRISAGSLTASRLLEHVGAGGGFSQLLMDFGKTKNLVASAALQEKAQKANAIATQHDIELATDEAFYNALQAQLRQGRPAKCNYTTDVAVAGESDDCEQTQIQLGSEFCRREPLSG